MNTFLMPIALIFAVTLTACSKNKKNKNTEEIIKDGKVTAKVIYGDDNRKDLYDVSDSRHLQWAQSTAALVDSRQLQTAGQDYVSLPMNTFGDAYGLCSSEPFRDQPNPAHCSGFLISDELFVTAGHCIQNQSACQSVSFVFGYGVFSSSVLPQYIPTKDVYKCAELIHSEVNGGGADFAIVRLNRKVLDRTPLNIRTKDSIQTSTPLVVIGHPSGLPTKVSDGAQVRGVSSAHFTTNLDTYGGNSGSAVFNDLTGAVEGILVRGETDFVRKGSCVVSNHCENNECRGEDVTKITEILDHVQIPQATEPPSSVEVTLYKILNNSPAPIPDYNSRGVRAVLEADEAPGERDIVISINISHTWRGDLSVTLISPEGDRYVLHNRSGGNSNNIIAEYKLQASAWQAQSPSQISTQVGNWNLHVIDHARRDQGQINSVKMQFIPQ